MVPPCCDRGDLHVRQRAPSVDAEGAQQRGERVPACGALTVHRSPGSQQHAQCRPDLAGPGPGEHRCVGAQHGTSRGFGIDWVGLPAGSSVGSSWWSRFEHGNVGLLQRFGQGCSVGSWSPRQLRAVQRLSDDRSKPMSGRDQSDSSGTVPVLEGVPQCPSSQTRVLARHRRRHARQNAHLYVILDTRTGGVVDTATFVAGRISNESQPGDWLDDLLSSHRSGRAGTSPATRSGRVETMPRHDDEQIAEESHHEPGPVPACQPTPGQPSTIRDSRSPSGATRQALARSLTEDEIDEYAARLVERAAMVDELTDQ
jgi:hypothetical protein